MNLFSVARWLNCAFIFCFVATFAAPFPNDGEEVKSDSSRDSFNTVKMNSIDYPMVPVPACYTVQTAGLENDSKSCLSCICSPFVCIFMTVLRVATCNFCCGYCSSKKGKDALLGEALSNPIQDDHNVTVS